MSDIRNRYPVQVVTAMTKESSEHLSSLMDGELTRETGLFLVRRLSSDETMCAKWERYHLIRDCIRQPDSKQLVTGLSAKLSVSLEAEEMLSVPTRTTRTGNRWLKPLSGFAIAASVALMAIIVTAPQQGESTGAADTALSTPAIQPFVSPNSGSMAPVSQAASYAPGSQSSSNRLNAYLLRHNQMARTTGRQGFVSFVPIVVTPAVNEAENSEDDAESTQPRPGLEATEN